MTDPINQFRQRGIFNFSSGYIVLKKIKVEGQAKRVQYYFIYVWTDKGKNQALIHQDKYNSQDPNELVKMHVYNTIGHWKLGVKQNVK